MPPISTSSRSRWQFRGSSLEFAQLPAIMGIVNTTPDSFSDGGRFLEPSAALDHALQLEAQGATLLDIGGESTRPGSNPILESEEIRRVVPAIAAISQACRLPISVDTTKSAVAREALLAGAQIVNDISGLTFDPRMVEVCAEFEAGVVCMHIQGTPQTMQLDPHYNDVVSEIGLHLRQRLAALHSAGIPAERVVLDPGIGFGKTAEHNLEILRALPKFRHLGRPILIGHSRKRFLQKLLGKPVDERLFGTVGVSVGAALLGAAILRVHDVAATCDAVTACLALFPEGILDRWPFQDPSSHTP